jgi:uncharacterized membrane protein
MTTEKSIMQMMYLLFILFTSIYIFRAFIRVEKEREKERAERKNKELDLTESLHDQHAK